MNNIVLSQKTRFLSPAILFICVVQLTKSTNITVLKCVCDIRNPSSSEVKINQLPTYCTAAATSQNNEDDVVTMASSKTNTPFILYYYEFSYEQWDQGMTCDKQFVAYMKDHKIDGIIFDNMYQGATYNVSRSQAILDFFQRLKKLNPNGLFGLALPKDADVLPFAFDYSFMGSAVDFYVVQTINYRPCVFRHINMQRTCTVGDMRKSLEALSQTMDMSKVLLTVQVYSIGVLNEDNDVPTLISYSDMCHYKGKQLSRYRKYCKDSLSSLWKKGALVSEFEMLGVYIQYIDYDDFAGKCGCETANNNNKFPATAAILSGMQKDSEKPDNCDFGDYDSTSSSSKE